MKQVAQVLRSGEVLVVDAPMPQVARGHLLVRNAFSLVSAGTERTKVQMGRKNLLQKAKSRPDLVRQVLDKVRSEGVAATFATVNERLDALSPLGYSTSGVVVAVGEDVSGFRVGDRVACAGAECAFHAEYVLVPQLLCASVPDGVPDQAAAYTTVGSIAMQGVRQADVSLGESVLVIGLGLIGQITSQLLRASGCLVVGADVAQEQVDRAIDAGFERSVRIGDVSHLERLREWSSGRGYDRVLITAAAPDNAPVILAGELARDKARIVFVGATPVDAPRSPFYEKELELVMSRSYGPGRYDPEYELHGHDYPIGYVRWTEQRNMQAFLQVLSSGGVDVLPLTTHTYDVEDAPQAYDLLADGRSNPVGILIRYPVSTGSESDVRVEDADEQSAGASIDTLARSGDGVVLVGVGNFATKTLLPALRRCGRLKPQIAVSARGLSAASAARNHGIPDVEGNPDLAFGRENLVAAVISTRHDSHAELAARAMRVGLAVFVEKPMCMRAAELPGLVAVHKTAGVPMMVGFNRRFAPATEAVVEARRRCPAPCMTTIRVDAGEIPLSHWIQDPEVGGGRLVGECCHFVDLAIYIAGSRVRRVVAVAVDKGRGAALSDTLQLTMEHDDASISSITYVADGSGSLGKERIEVFCGGMTAVIDDFKEWVIGSRATTAHKRASQDKGHAREIAAFCDAVLERRESPELTFDDALHSTLVTFAAAQSLLTGSWVLMDEYAANVLG